MSVPTTVSPMAAHEMIVQRDVSIMVDDGLVLRADVFRPADGTPAPVIMTLGPYGKGIRWEDSHVPQWKSMMAEHPNWLPGSTRSNMTWETPDPDTWVKWGYVVMRVDSRGAGRSSGKIDCFSPRETKDYYDAIEWAAGQPWCSGKVGLLGISYYAINQWLVASLQPPHLSAMIPWEGAGDFYRDTARHGGIMSNKFFEFWYPFQVIPRQHGNPTALLDPWMGESCTGPDILSADTLVANRTDPVRDILQHPLDDQFYRNRSPDWSRVTVPFLSAANWAGFGLHSRGNFEAFTQAASTQKWLEGHPGKHEEWFYLEQPMAMQKKFFDHFLKDHKNGWDEEPSVWLHLRRPFSIEFELRKEHQWPLSSTKWTSMYLSASDKALNLSGDQPTTSGTTTFDALGDPVTFLSAPLERETELTGPLAAKLFVSSSTADADLFVTLQAFSPDGKEVEFQGTVDPHTPLAQGWLRASHRKLDLARSKPYCPFHSHDEILPVKPGEIYELDIEIWPTCIILPAGFKLGLQISGHDFERKTPGDIHGPLVFRGSGPWLHTNMVDRPESIFGGKTTIHTGSATPSYLTLPVIEPN